MVGSLVGNSFDEVMGGPCCGTLKSRGLWVTFW